MKDDAPKVIIKRRGGRADKHYHGAWKIALADFMTALMSLFLVLWVVSTSNPEQLRGLANYFSTPLARAMAGGNRDTAGESPIPGGGEDPSANEGEVARVHLRAQMRTGAERRRLRQLRERIMAIVDADPKLSQLAEQMHLEMTPDGLRIRLSDSERRPMFELGSERLEPYMHDLLQRIAPLLNELPNGLAIYGYTDDRPYQGGDLGYSNWELSSGRANASRRTLVESGLDGNKLFMVVGMADRVPLPDTEPSAAVNRRIELLVLTGEAMTAIRSSAQSAGVPLAADADGRVPVPTAGPAPEPPGPAADGAIRQALPNAAPAAAGR